MATKIRTTHVGSLPRTKELLEANLERSAGTISEEKFHDILERSVADVVKRQLDLGLDIINEGEYGHITSGAVDYGAWWNYSFTRLGGLTMTDKDRWEIGDKIRSEPGKIRLSSMKDRRDRALFSEAYNDPDSGIFTGRKKVANPEFTGPVTYIGQDQVAADVKLLADALPHTLILAACAIGLGLIVAVAVAFIATLPGMGAVATFFRGLPSFMVSLPGFWIGILLIQVFSFQLGWIRVIEPGSVEGLILPTLTLAVPMAAPLIQVLIRSLDETQSRPFVQAVRSRGASESWIFWRTTLRNSLLPTLTMAGLLFGELVGGAVVTETVFGRTGLGQMTAQAVANRDTPVLLAVVLIAATSYIIINLVVDLLYPVLDPRLRKGSADRTAASSEERTVRA